MSASILLLSVLCIFIIVLSWWCKYIVISTCSNCFIFGVSAQTYSATVLLFIILLSSSGCFIFGIFAKIKLYFDANIVWLLIQFWLFLSVLLLNKQPSVLLNLQLSCPNCFLQIISTGGCCNQLKGICTKSETTITILKNLSMLKKVLN